MKLNGSDLEGMGGGGEKQGNGIVSFMGKKEDVSGKTKGD